MADRRHKRTIAGAILIFVGLALFFFERLEDVGHGAILIVLGGAFLIGYFLRRDYGLLVPGGILTGLGIGRMAERTLSVVSDNPSLLGLGLGFLAIYALAFAFERKAHYWPLIPGGVLVLTALPNSDRIFAFLYDSWPLLLALIGVLVLISGLRRKAPDA